jgi:hypothetical protein
MQPEPPPLGLLLRHLQALSAPQPLHPLVVHHEAFRPQQRGHTRVAVPPIVARQLHHPLHQPRLIAGHMWHPPLGGPGLSQHPTRPPLRYPYPTQGIPYMLHRRPAFGRA